MRAEGAPLGEVHRRRFIYVQGYDPRGLAEYYRLFRTEYRRTLALYGLQGSAAKLDHLPDVPVSAWNWETQGRGWIVHTRFEFLRWEDIIRRDFARPGWWKIVHGCRAVGTMILSGTMARMWRANWRFGGFALYPAVTLIGLAAIGALLGWLVAKLAGLVVPPLLAMSIGSVVGAVALIALIRAAEKHTYMLYLFDDFASTVDFAYGKRPDWDERIDVFARHVVAAAQAGDADEIVIAGHSSGSFFALDIVARAFTLDPELGRRGARVALLTVGANLPAIGFQPPAQWFRDRIRQLATEPGLDWIDYQSRKDIMNFYPFDPVRGHGIELGAARVNPTVQSISFRDIIKPEHYRDFRRRFFRVHFQFIMANELRAAYDFYLIAAGPFTLRTRATHPRMVLDALAEDQPLSKSVAVTPAGAASAAPLGH